MTPTYCQECSRANGASAKRCIWCGVPLVNQNAPEEFAATKIEIDYLDGIERLDGSATVRLIINLILRLARLFAQRRAPQSLTEELQSQR